MRILRKLLLLLGCLVLAVCVTAAWYYYKGFYNARRDQLNMAVRLKKAETGRLSGKAAEIRSWLAGSGHGYNNNLVFLVDMRLPSGRNRFFVYDLKKDSILTAGLVAHGSCNLSFSMNPSFSNVSGSGCSSLGRYKVGGPYKGQFGTAYKLHGIDTTNDQAFARNVVLHSYTCVPDGETDPLPICNSKGCAMVAPGFLQHIQPYIDGSKKPILLWIFD